MKISNRYITPIQSPIKWEKTADGFLRCTLRVLAEGIMKYKREELGDIPDCCSSDPLNLFVPLDEMKSARSLRTLEGAPVVIGQHSWLTPQVIKDCGVGNVAGTPKIDGPWLVCDVLITDPQAIQDIENKKYTDVSAAYLADTVFEDNKFYEGNSYDGYQTGLRYNHIAIIEPGTGRGGEEVRILNKDTKPMEISLKGEQQMPDEKKVVKVQLKNTGKYVNTDDAGAESIAAEEKKSTGDMESTLNQVEESNGALAALQEENEKLKGELIVYKERLDAAMNPEVIQKAAENMVEETGKAHDIIEVSEGEDEEKKKEFQNSIKGVHGTELHKAVLSRCSMKIENMTEAELRGAFNAKHQISQSCANNKVNGTKMTNTSFPQTPVNGGPQQRSGHEKLGFK